MADGGLKLRLIIVEGPLYQTIERCYNAAQSNWGAHNCIQ